MKNACDISPAEFGYCQADIGGISYLARFGRKELRWVAKLPCFSFAATFGSVSDTYYFSCQSTAGLYAIENVDSLMPFMLPSEAADLSATAPIMSLSGTPE